MTEQDTDTGEAAMIDTENVVATSASDWRLTLGAAQIRRQEGAEAARAWARRQGFAIRWNRAGDLFIRDLGMEG